MKGVVVCPQPRAAEEGSKILAKGGNAIDAAVACAFTQAIVAPTMCGVGGFGTMFIYMGKTAEKLLLDFHGRAGSKVTPDMWQAYNGKIMQESWPGSLTISQDTQKRLLYEITEGIINMGFKKIMYINSHGQNLFTMEAAVRLIADNYKVHIPFVFTYKIAANFMENNRKSKNGGICHACELETSLMMYLTDFVDMSKAEKNQLNYKSKFRNTDGMKGGKVFWSTWALEKTESGVLGDPTVATKKMGKKVFDYLVDEISEFAIEYYKFEK